MTKEFWCEISWKVPLGRRLNVDRTGSESCAMQALVSVLSSIDHFSSITS
jgi:hypothetical protein